MSSMHLICAGKGNKMLCFVRRIPVLLTWGIILFPPCLWILASALHHVNPIFPYVSDLGVEPPEASLFSFCMCFGAALLALFTVLRYDLTLCQVGQPFLVTIWEDGKAAPYTDPETVNRLGSSARRSLVSGLAMAFAFLLVGCFRNNETDLVQVLHNLFAGVGFFCALLDMYFERGNASLLGYERTARNRSAILWTSVGLLVFYTSNGVASFVANPTVFTDKRARLLWSPHETGYALHLMSTSVEWLLIYMLAVYLSTFGSMFVRARRSNAGNKHSAPA